MLYAKISNIINKLRTDDAFSNTALVTGAFIFSGFFSYLLQIYLGRKLSLADYGVFNALLSLITLLTFFNTGVAISATKVVSELFGQKKKDILTGLFWQLCTLFTLSGGVVLILLNIFRSQFLEVLNIEDASYVFFFSIYVVVRYLSVPPAVYLQGLLRFKAFSYYSIFSAILRLAVIGGLAYLGYTVGILYLGSTVAEFITFVLAMILVKDVFSYKTRPNLKPQLKRIMTLSGPVLTIYFSLLFYYNIDILMVQRFFDSESSGLYVGAATMGKIILFGTGAIATVMFPQISAMWANSENIKAKFNMFVLLQVWAVVAALILFCIFPKFITYTLFGVRYAGSINLLPLYSVFIALNVLINFVVRFLMAVDKTQYSYILLLVTIVQTALLFFYHTSLQQILYINIVLMSLLFIYLSFYLKPYFRPA